MRRCGACGGRTGRAATPSSLRPLSVELDFFPNADHAALFAAIDKSDWPRVQAMLDEMARKDRANNPPKAD